MSDKTKKLYERVARTAFYALSSALAVFLGGQCERICVYILWGSATTAGQIVVEHAPYKEYTGAWSNLATFDWVAGGTMDTYRGEGAWGAVRVRVATAVAGGEGSDAGGADVIFYAN